MSRRLCYKFMSMQANFFIENHVFVIIFDVSNATEK